MEHGKARKVEELFMSDWARLVGAIHRIDAAPGKIVEKSVPNGRLLQCPKCQLRMPLRDDHNYFGDYDNISNHSLSHDPRVVGAWNEVVKAEVW